MADAALLLEAARIVEARDRKNATPGLYPIVATFHLLFTTPGGEMVGDLRKGFDDMAKLCSFDPKEVRTRPFRHTYCSARSQTVNRILKPGKAPDEPDAWEGLGLIRARIAAGIVAIALGGCSELIHPDSDAQVAVQAELESGGEAVTLSILNESADSILFNRQCGLGLEYRDGNEWRIGH